MDRMEISSMTTPAPDWADMIADRIEATAHYSQERAVGKRAMAAALRKVASDKEAEFIQRERKAKADGVRIAVDDYLTALQFVESNTDRVLIENIAGQLRTFANEIERGQV